MVSQNGKTQFKIQIIMLENIVIIVVGLMFLSASFLIGLFVGIGSALDIVDADHQRENDLHCFECEIEMPVKEKDGQFYCSNCGLYHGSKI
jgi:hypothetical protein